MSSRNLLRLAALGAFLAACGPHADGPGAASVEPRTAPAASSASVASTEAAPPAATTAAAATTDAPAPAPEPLPPPPTGEALAKLPPGAAMYFAVRAGEVSQTLASRAASRGILDELGRGFGGASPDAILTEVGVDMRRTILGAVVPASEKSARAVVDGMAAGASGKAEEKLVAAHAADATRVRLLVPMAKGADAGRAAATLAKALAGNAAMDACPGAASCAGFGADAPLGVAQGKHAAVAAYADGPDLRLDVVMPLFAPATDPGALAALVAFHGAHGGFNGRCSRFDAGATLSLCVDAAPAGELGATTGYSKTAQALSGASIDPKTKRRIAEVGRAESQRNLELATPARRLASDGTLVVTARGDRSSALSTWALSDASRPAIEKAFPRERCAAGRALIDDLLPTLRAAFGDPGKGFTDPRKTYEAFMEAGWGAWAVTFAGTWANLLEMVSGQLAKDGKNLAVPSAIEVCARTEAGRLVLLLKERP